MAIFCYHIGHICISVPLYVDITSFGILSSTCWTSEKWPQDPAHAVPRCEDDKGGYQWQASSEKLLDRFEKTFLAVTSGSTHFFGGSLSTENSKMMMIIVRIVNMFSALTAVEWNMFEHWDECSWVNTERERESEHVWVLLDLIWTSYINVDGWRNKLIFDEIFGGPQFMSRHSTFIFCGISGSPGVPRRSPLTIGCPRNWMNMWSCDCTMLSPRASCWRTGRIDWQLSVPGPSCTDWGPPKGIDDD